MKKIILSLALASLFVACKEETKEKVGEATEAISGDLKEVADSAGIKAQNTLDTVKSKTTRVLDTVKAKTKNVIEKGAEKVEEGAKKVKESVKK